MFCPSCGKEPPDDSQFWRSVRQGHIIAVHTDSSTEKGPPLRLIGLALLFFLLVGAYLAQNRSSTTSPSSNQNLIPVRTTLQRPLTNGVATINAASYVWYTFTIPARVNSVAVNGHFTASGGTGNDIECYILEEDGFANLKNGHPAKTSSKN